MCISSHNRIVKKGRAAFVGLPLWLLASLFFFFYFVFCCCCCFEPGSHCILGWAGITYVV